MPETFSKLATFLKCLFGPRLYRIHSNPAQDYVPNNAEFYMDVVIKSLDTVIWSFGFYTSPIILSYLYRRGYFTAEGLVTASKLLAALGSLVLFAVSIRGIGRYFNTQYFNFITNYHEALRKHAAKDPSKLYRMYDFDFTYWPIDYKQSQPTPADRHMQSKRSFGITAIPCEVLSYVVAHMIGRPMLYPGSVTLFQAAMGPMLLQGRSALVERHNGKRSKVATGDGNYVDTMFVDKRGHTDGRGKTLVVCCEGNAGFYEYGTVSTPLEAGYSTLGWNHPGFGGSSGLPFPEQESAAIDAVMQYAIQELGFPVENIVLYAWSIGGYTASWVAMNYPEIKSIVLDATFDDLIPLAISKMPASWKPLVVRTVRRYLNLNIVENLLKYNGPVMIFRRSKDEIITTVEGLVETNRGNDLLISLLKYRYPNLVDEGSLGILKKWLSLTEKIDKENFLRAIGIDDELYKVQIASSHVGESRPSYPNSLGEGLDLTSKTKLLIYLARNYMVDFNATHCIPLPANLFKMPWQPHL